MHFTTVSIDAPMVLVEEHDAAAEVTLGYEIDCDGNPCRVTLESVDSFALCLDGVEYELTPAAQEAFVRRWLATRIGEQFAERACQRHYDERGQYERRPAYAR